MVKGVWLRVCVCVQWFVTCLSVAGLSVLCVGVSVAKMAGLEGCKVLGSCLVSSWFVIAPSKIVFDVHLGVLQ